MRILHDCRDKNSASWLDSSVKLKTRSTWASYMSTRIVSPGTPPVSSVCPTQHRDCKRSVEKSMFAACQGQLYRSISYAMGSDGCTFRKSLYAVATALAIEPNVVSCEIRWSNCHFAPGHCTASEPQPEVPQRIVDLIRPLYRYAARCRLWHIGIPEQDLLHRHTLWTEEHWQRRDEPVLEG
ncbi:hypothetical protein K466DRAFT_53912 [Polyporus arcularius HHB13444]|uniref:Uncharacterized protein n=1 Tax=Polyporus arcularius HHB13444 TaxID=1314778 RepID=A0A5C3PRV4_9APHY|nr:hypothetical protein K466DRAFT_53912 [Polyporus arcularius HHB13444]